MTHRRHNRARTFARRKGGAILELIIALPVLVIGIFAIVQFAILQASEQQLEYASRIGAKMASEDATIGALPAGPLPADIVDAILRNLEEANLNTAPANYLIRLEHNVGLGNTLESGGLVCPARATDPPLPTTGQYVRVTVCMDIVAGDLTPNLLQTYGFDVNGRIAQQQTTYRYE